ncbi:FAD-dependent oxidoreductase [Lactobacillus delbrueckii]|uniref:FAD-dependent oxidoreductase n=1 Tax=Lactobacillus delbrueckii TaxID=1584 RepID=UPI003A853587
MKASKRKYDLVIVGSGLSGASAAAEAADQGLDTLLVEKGRNLGGTGNYVEGVLVVGSDLQKAQGVTITAEDILREEYDWTHGLADLRIWKSYLQATKGNFAWLKSHGAQMTKLRTLGTGENTWHLFDGHGKQAITEGLLPAARWQGVEIITSSQVIRLEVDLAGKISGLVIADYESQTEYFVQTEHVILATGGYLNNPELLRSHTSGNAKRIIPVNSGKNTGDGLKLAWSIGAKKFGMGMVMMFGGQVMDQAEPGFKNWSRQINRAVTHEGPLWVNERGDRFTNEDCTDIWAIAGNALIRQEKVYAILNQEEMRALSQQAFKNTDLKYDQLLADLQDDLEQEKSYLTCGDSLEELAQKLDLPHLLDSVKRYNELAKGGKDLDFGKDSRFLHPLEAGSYYAFELGIGAFCTMGGLRTDLQNRVLDQEGNWIRGLYTVGNDGSAGLVGDTYGVNIPGSEAGYCVYSGRVAAQDVAEQLQLT